MANQATAGASFDRLHDAKVRTSAFNWLNAQVQSHGDVLSRTVLAEGFLLDGTRIRFLGPQGIFKPRILTHAPLSITTTPESPYDDSFGPGEMLRYRYRGTNPQHPDNRRLRFTMQERLPLAYFHGIVPGRYLAVWPVFVVGDDPNGLTFTIAVDDATQLRLSETSSSSAVLHDDQEDIRRQYVTAAVRQRVHQRTFRERVLTAYRSQCAFCRLRHEELLDAAHIVPDADPEGEPTVRNGLALCKLHHAAFDRCFLGVRPDGIIQVRPDILEESDGPTLVHSIQALHGRKLYTPRPAHLKPGTDLLEARYARFLASSL